MKSLTLALTLALSLLGSAWAADPKVDAFKARFAPQEQILLALILVDGGAARQFSADAQAPSEAHMQAWRGRIAQASRDYLAKPHPLNSRSKTVQGMVEPGEWAALKVSLRMLADGGFTDQAKFRIFLSMIDEANEALKDGDDGEAKKVINMARPKLTEAMTEYLASETGKRALAAADAAQAADAAEKKRLADAEAARRKAEQAAAAKKPAAAQPVVAASTPTAVAGGAKPAARPAEKTAAQTAREQAEAAERAARAALDKPKVEDVAESGRVFDGSTGAGGTTSVVDATSSGAAPKLEGSGLLPATGKVPTLAVIPPEPGDDEDMAELRKMKKKVSGKKKWFAAAGGGLLGALLGFLVAGPIGAVVGALALGGAGFFGGKYLFG